jgi:hypothetical protein
MPKRKRPRENSQEKVPKTRIWSFRSHQQSAQFVLASCCGGRLNGKLTINAHRGGGSMFSFRGNADIAQNLLPAPVRYSFAGGAHKHGADLEKREVG